MEIVPGERQWNWLQDVAIKFPTQSRNSKIQIIAPKLAARVGNKLVNKFIIFRGFLHQMKTSNSGEVEQKYLSWTDKKDNYPLMGQHTIQNRM